MAFCNLLTLKDRIHDIDIQMQRSDNKLSSFEIKVLNSLRGKSFGSDKQCQIISGIEVKLFGFNRELEEKKETFRVGTL